LARGLGPGDDVDERAEEEVSSARKVIRLRSR